MDDLTVRILTLSARGLATGEVAERLGLPAEVVRERLHDAMVELGASSKLELILLAIRSGQVSV
jgi:DNA-binding NarL/FixJ family response regulator